MSLYGTFTDRSIEAITEKQSLLCVGLDPQIIYMPPHLVRNCIDDCGLSDDAFTISQIYLRFNKAIIDAIADVAVWVKPQSAFYEERGAHGISVLEQTIAYARKKGLLVIVDGKRGDGGDTANAYAETYIGQVCGLPDAAGNYPLIDSPLRADAVTIHAQIGKACVFPFAREIREHGTAAFVVGKTSFTPNSVVEQILTSRGKHVWEELAGFVSEWGEGTEGPGYGWRNLGVVLGATKPEDAPMMRRILPKAWFLVPGYGAQGGEADDAVLGADEDGFGITVNSSRGVIFAYAKDPFRGRSEDFAACARNAAIHSRDDLNAALRRAGKGRAFLK